MIFDLLAPPQGPRGGGAKKMCRCTPHSREQPTHQIWLDFVQQFRRRYRDRRTDGGDCNIPDAFLKKRGDKKYCFVPAKGTFHLSTDFCITVEAPNTLYSLLIIKGRIE